jgi:hypothetical protein
MKRERATDETRIKHGSRPGHRIGSVLSLIRVQSVFNPWLIYAGCFSLLLGGFVPSRLRRDGRDPNSSSTASTSAAWSAGVLDPLALGPGSAPLEDVFVVAKTARDVDPLVRARSGVVMVVSSGIIPTAPPVAATGLIADGVTR